MELKERIALIQDSVIAHRRWLHAHPEISGQEKETAATLPQRCGRWDLTP